MTKLYIRGRNDDNFTDGVYSISSEVIITNAKICLSYISHVDCIENNRIIADISGNRSGYLVLLNASITTEKLCAKETIKPKSNGNIQNRGRNPKNRNSGFVINYKLTQEACGHC